MNSKSQYIDIQTGQEGGTSWLGNIYSAATSAITAVTWSTCHSDAITDYLNIFANDDQKVDKKTTKKLYEIFVAKKTGEQMPTREELITLNNNFFKLVDLNTQINKYLSKQTKIPDAFKFENENEGLNEYTELCNLYKNYSFYISDTDKTIDIIKQIANDTNYLSESYSMNSLIDTDLNEALINLRIGKILTNQQNEKIKQFINKYKFLLIGLVESIDLNSISNNFLNFELFNFLDKIAKKFKIDYIDKRPDDGKYKKLITIFNEPIDTYINKFIKKFNPINLQDYESIKLSNSSYLLTENGSNALINNQDLPFFNDFYYTKSNSVIPFDRQNNKYFYIWYISKIKSAIIYQDIENVKQKFNKYVNVFRDQTKQISMDQTNQAVITLYENREDIEDAKTFIKQCIEYNKSLNNWFLKEKNIDYETIDYRILYNILKDIPDEYLDFNKMSQIINTNFSNISLESLNKLKTPNDISYNQIDKGILNVCVLSKIANKTLSGIKIFLYIYECAKNILTQNTLDDQFKLIHYYLTTEKNEKKLIKFSKLERILTKLVNSTSTESDIKLLDKIYLKKKIQNPTITNALNILQLENTDKNQKYLYNLLLFLSPEKLEWNIGSLITSYITETFSSYVKSFSFIRFSDAPVVNLDSIKNFIIKQQSNANPKWEDLDAFKIYSYFNFDCLIVNKMSLKVILELLKKHYKHLK